MSVLGEHPYRNILVFALGTVISAFGAFLSTQSILGVSPSSAVPIVIYDAFSISMGTSILIIQLLFLIAGLALIGVRNFRWVYLLCIPTLLLYSYSTDVFDMALSQYIHPDNYLMEWVLIIIATAIHALGIALQLVSNLSMTPLDMFANFLSCRIGREYGVVKVAVDVSLVVIAVILSFILLGKLSSIREGTIFAAIGVGMIVRYISKFFKAKGMYEWAGHLTIDIKPKGLSDKGQ